MYFKNLGSALLSLLLSIDRLGNALCGGFPSVTISGRVGFFASTKKNKYWKCLEWIINETFRPLEGEDHCFNAYIWESKQALKHRRGSNLALILLSFFVVLGCLLIAPVVWIIAKIKK